MGVSKNRGTPKSSILIGFGTIINIYKPSISGVFPLFLETPIYLSTPVMSLADNLIMRFLSPMTACLMVDVGVPKARFFFAFFFFFGKN